MASNGTFSFSLYEKVDSHGEAYMFAALPIFNAVLFIRAEPEQPDGVKRWRAELKPYRPSDIVNNATTVDEPTHWVEQKERKRR